MTSLQYGKVTRQNHWNSATATLQNNSSISSSVSVVKLPVRSKDEGIWANHSTGKKTFFIDRIIKSTPLFISALNHTKSRQIEAHASELLVLLYLHIFYPVTPPLSKRNPLTHISLQIQVQPISVPIMGRTSNGVLNVETSRVLLLYSRSKTGSNHLISSVSLFNPRNRRSLQSPQALFSLIGVYFISFCGT